MQFDAPVKNLPTVLITRPNEDSQQLAVQLKRNGIASIVMPLYDFSAHSDGLDIGASFSGSAGRKLAVFTSPRAVQFGLALIPQALRSELEYAVVGAATGRLLEQAGQNVDWMPKSGFTSEDLLSVRGLNLHAETGGGQSPGQGNAIIFCAPGGRDVLQSGLQSMGWLAKKALVYRRRVLVPAEQITNEILNAESLLSVWTSTSALSAAEKNLPSKVWAKILQAPALVISARIKHHLEQQGASDVALASGPGNADLLQSICSMADVKRSPIG